MNSVLAGVRTNPKPMANAKAVEAVKPQKAINETQTTSHQRGSSSSSKKTEEAQRPSSPPRNDGSSGLYAMTGIQIIVVIVAVIIMVFGESM
eukprot:CAMPEP_0197055028 /NCGR_PEP_ID=MMETSP1384-20130603/55139_1 /TAXON_ID=29189 /ORGANISM="Ammonia sp." /LENGTH=91 /DNA_ID=CAMNT_0042488435 /DNA_START=26 /DNA_END=298 /DNA_ORIENTATION=-